MYCDESIVRESFTALALITSYQHFPVVKWEFTNEHVWYLRVSVQLLESQMEQQLLHDGS